MNNEHTESSRKKNILKLKHVTALLIMSAALISSLDQTAYAISKPAIDNVRNYIYLTYREKSENLAAINDSKKRKGFKSEDRFEILSVLTGESVKELKERVKNGENPEAIAREYNVSDEYNRLVLDAYNCSLDKLYSDGKLSEEEYNSMYNNADLSFINSCDTKPKAHKETGNSGNITALLAEVINKEPSEVEEMLIAGQNPWDIAKEYDKFRELKDLVFEDTLYRIDTMLESGEITNSEADDIISDFENSFLSRINSH